MADGIKGKVRYWCSNCGTKHTLRSDDFDFDITSASERGMGPEVGYTSLHQMTCDECNQEIFIKLEVWEYPSGILNHLSHEGVGTSEVKVDLELINPEDEETSARSVGAGAGGAILGASLAGPVGAIIGGFIGVILGKAVDSSEDEEKE